jgi:hypothetical protein
VERVVGDAVGVLFGIPQPGGLAGVGTAGAATGPDPGQFQADPGAGSAGAQSSPGGTLDGSTGTPAAGSDAPMYHPDLPTPEK